MEGDDMETALNSTNSSSNVTSGDDLVAPSSDGEYEPWQVLVITVICSIIVAGTIVGNLLVCVAVAIVRKLRTPSNLLIVSLAVSDLFVALLDMPFATMYEVMGRWVLGQGVCDTWTSLDVLLCTASILNLCVISVDRYFVITKPFQYAMKRTPIRMLLMIAAVWSLSALISIPPLFGWKAEPKEGLCVVSQAIGYQFLATIGAFYFPLTIMIIIYTKIYLVSSRIANAEARSKPTITYNDEQQPSGASGMATPLRKDSQVGQDKIMHQIEENHNIQNGNKKAREFSIGEILPNALAARSNRSAAKKLRFNRPSASNERKATKTLGVIMGAFTACWLPFFILALIKPFCSNPETCIPHWLNGLFLWLGYTNSFLNPIIYARFNRDFRTPFKHILQCHCRDINSRLRSENFNEQYGRPDQQQQQHSCTSDAAQVRYSICRGQSVIKLP